MSVTATQPNEESPLRPVRFARRSSRGFMYGMSKLRFASVTVGFVTVAATLFSVGAVGLMVTAPVWVSAVVVAFVPLKGRKIIDWLPVLSNWGWRKFTGQHEYRARPLKPRPAGTLALPGDAARLRVVHDGVSGTVMIHDPHENSLTAAMKVSHGAFVLVDPASQASRTEGWGRVLGGLASHDRGISRVQVLERALPDAGVDVRAWWNEHGVDDGSWMAEAYQELLAQAAPASERHETYVAIKLNLQAVASQMKEQGGGLAGAAAVMRQRMASIEAAVRGAELVPAGWLDESDLAWLTRTVYDPSSARLLDGQTVGHALPTAGPIAVDEEWSRLRSDTGWHAALWVSEWPRLSVLPGFLWPLVLAPNVRRSLSLVMEPVPTASALKEVRKERFEYMSDQAGRDRRGQITDFSTEQELEDVNKREVELVTGHGDMRYAAFITVSAPAEDALAAAVDEITNAAIESYCEVRVLWGEQGTGFIAGSLPVCRGL